MPSTRTQDRAAAERLLAERLAAAAPDPSASSSPKIADVLNAYVESIRDLPSHEQAAVAARHFKVFFGAQTVEALDIERQQAYVDHRHRQGIRAATISRELSVLRAALNHAHRENAAIAVPRIYDVPPSPPRDRWLTPEEFARLVGACKSPHLRLYMLLAVATAARPDAVLDLTWDAVDLRAGIINLNPRGRVQTSKHRPIVRINDALRAALLEAKERRRTNWVIEYGGYPVKSIKTAFRAAAALAGFAPGEVVPYTLRHTAATWMAQAGVPLWEIAGFLGHADTRMVERTYAHHHPEYQRRAAAAIEARLARAPLAPQLHPGRAPGTPPAQPAAEAKKRLKNPPLSTKRRQS